jgi:acetyltransferase
MADHPLPLGSEHRLPDGRRVTIRPILPQDEAGERRFFERLSPQAKRLRFMKLVHSLNDKLIHFFTHIDYDRHMAFVCEHEGRLVGDARYVAHPGGRSCEFGVVIADDWHGSGIAALLLDALIRAAQARGLETMEGLVLRSNAPMLRFAEDLGFEVAPEPREPSMVRVVKRLTPAAARHRA